MCRHSKLLNVQGGRLTKKVCRRRVDEDMKTRRHIWLVCRHITIIVSTRQREVLTFHDCEYMQSRRIGSHVDVLQETPEGVSAYQATEVDAISPV